MSSIAFSHRVPEARGPAYPASGRLAQKSRPCVFSHGSMGGFFVLQLDLFMLRGCACLMALLLDEVDSDRIDAVDPRSLR